MQSDDLNDTGTQEQDGWWNSRWLFFGCLIVSMVPLLWPSVPPLIDLPGHMGRYTVQLDPATYANWYGFRWQLIGNLGVDLLIEPMSRLFGLELGTKLIVMTIPALTAAGLLWIAREVHGRVPPTAYFALPLAYGHPFMFGFVNFSLSMALALCAFALWLRLGRYDRLRLRAALFLVIGPLLWLTHTYGWAALCVLTFSAETVRQHDRLGKWFVSLFHAGLQCLSLAPPLLLMLAWRTGHVGGGTSDWFNWIAKRRYIVTTLRDRWETFDQASLWLLFIMIVVGMISRRNFKVSRNLTASALCLLAVFVFLPRIVFGSAYADMRLTPFIFAVAVIAVRPQLRMTPRIMGALAVVSLSFFAVRTAATTVSFAMADQGYKRALGALDHIPRGARVVSFVGASCQRLWSTNRMEHLPAFALIRRGAYTNDQWDMAGAQLLTLRLPAGFFNGDSSQLVTQRYCWRELWKTIDQSLLEFPRGVFDYVWLIDAPPYDPRSVRGLTQIWRDGNNALYRVDHNAPKPEQP